VSGNAKAAGCCGHKVLNSPMSVQKPDSLAFADYGKVGAPMPADGGYAEAVIEEFHREGVDAFAASWHALLTRIRDKCAAPALRA
jgi:hypothetical protein